MSLSFNVVRIVCICCALLSLLGTVVVLSSVYLFKPLRTLSYALICQLSVSQAMYPLAFLFFYNPADTGTPSCTIQGVYIQFFVSSSLYFSCAISTHLYFTLTDPLYRFTTQGLIKTSTIVYTIALVNSLVPINYMTNQGNACYITDDNILLTILLQFVQFVAIVLYNAYCYYCTYHYFESLRSGPATRSAAVGLSSPLVQAGSTSGDRVASTLYKFQYYPVIVFVCWTAASVFHLLGVFAGLPFWLSAIALGLACLNGFFDTILFVSFCVQYGNVRRLWRDMFHFYGLLSKGAPAGDLAAIGKYGVSSYVLEEGDCDEPPLSSDPSDRVERETMPSREVSLDGCEARESTHSSFVRMSVLRGSS